MKIVLPMMAMLVAGLALGFGGASLMWSGMVSRAHAGNKDWQVITQRWEKLANENHAGWQQCLSIISRR